MSGELHVVATPIGNLGDMTHRGIATLNAVDVVYAEDTRRSGILFAHYDIKTPRRSLHAQSSMAKVEDAVARIAAGETAALISDAGTPCVSDPGFRLVRACASKGIKVIPIPGASALPAVLSVSGVPTTPLLWHGFLPHKKGRQTKMKHIAELTDYTHAMYESVHRIEKLLTALAEHVPDRLVVIGRELTKQFEEVLRGTPALLIAHFAEHPPRGEFVVLVAPSGYNLH